ncbi:uncharacterized protein METZ01_LOCUS323323, partial [marine metagenome]
VIIAGDTADNINGFQNIWTATRMMDSSDVEGVVTFNITPQDLAGNPGGTSTQTTNGSRIIYDNTVPFINDINECNFTEDKDYTLISDTLRLGISGGDLLSGIKNYKFCLGNSRGSNEIIFWTDTDGIVDTLVGEITFNQSLTQNVPYFASAFAIDRAGNVSDTIFGDGFIVDTTAPSTGIIYNDGFDNDNETDWTIDSTRLDVRWDSFDDNPSNLSTNPIPLLIGSYELSILDEPDTVKVLDWFTVDTLADSATITGIALQKNMKYFVAVRAVDMAGNKSDSVRTDEIRFDNQPAKIETVTPSLNTYLNVLSSDETIDFKFNKDVTYFTFSISNIGANTLPYDTS